MKSIAGQTVEVAAHAESDSVDVRAIITFTNGKSLEFIHGRETDSTSLVG